ncbi:MAG: ABC transporter ATP-binding protein [Bradyrhizobiaceae bacterium]|nr:ABC transporter ATP-binding protein [Bradyrhizobiaceae bacterium]
MRLSALKSWFTDPKRDGWILRRLVVGYGRNEAKRYAVALVLGAVTAATTAFSAYIVGTVVNEAYVSKNFAAIAGLAVVIICVFALKGLATYGANVIMARISYRIMAEMQRQVFDKLLLEGLSYFSNRHSTELLAKLTTGARAAAQVLQMVVNTLSRDLLTIIGLASVMVIQDPLMSLIGFVAFPPAIYFLRGLMRRTRDIGRAEVKTGMRIHETIQETIRGFPVVKAFTLEKVMRDRVHDSIAKIQQRQNALARIEHRASPIMEALGGLSIALVLLYGAYRVIELGATPGEFVSFITAFLLAYEPAKRIARLQISMTRTLVAVRHLFEILDSSPLEPAEPESSDFRIGKGRVRFDNVEFAYRPGEPVLRRLSFVAEAGQMTAFVGHSGGGKSTVVSLILRFYEPQAGAIEIDGVNIRQIPRRTLRSQIAYVGQDIFLFNGTIAENIGFGKLGAGRDEIEAAAKAAFAHDFIKGFAEGYDTRVGEGGAKLSAGQRQRIAVARALIRNAPIILLDEATSSLDSKAEREVQMAIERLREGRTCIAIAHRLHTIMQADQICVIESGRIVERGTHRDLMQRGGFYAEMFRLQSEERPDAEPPEREIEAGDTVAAQ